MEGVSGRAALEQFGRFSTMEKSSRGTLLGLVNFFFNQKKKDTVEGPSVYSC